MKKPKNFEEAMQRLETIVAKLEQGNIPLEESIKKYKEGIELTQFCGNKLNEVEKQIKQLVKSDKGFTLHDTEL